ncbi:MAG: CinA family nicotinamide mononucleotide deamidase-related protein [Actinobacteria bacterium]|nr:MAG: CinA family nicotinamide mononucleotide deamidase-related protein [Actinomycetota bacterium]
MRPAAVAGRAGAVARRTPDASGYRGRDGDRDRRLDLGRAAEEGAGRPRHDARADAGGRAAARRGEDRPADRYGASRKLLAGGAQRVGDRPHHLPGDARAWTAPRLHRPEVVDHARPAREPSHDLERAHPRPARRRRQDADRHLARGSPRRLIRPRAVVVVTGSELVRGDRRDLNGPFLAGELVRRGIEPARILIVGDREDELAGALGEGLRADLCVVSGGLGPTHDDRTVELVARAAGAGLRVDEDLHRQIGDISRAFAQRMNRPYVDFEQGVRKQATIPEGAVSLGLAGTAPGLVLEAGEGVVVVLPGPPGELQRLWREAVEAEPVRRVFARAQPPDVRLLRFFGASESAVAKALADAGGDGDGVEATICARDFEIHVDMYVQPGAEARADELVSGLAAPLERYLFSRDDRRVEELALDLCRARGLTLATAESCTGGMVAERLTSVPGSSQVFLGGIVAYADEVKAAELGVSPELLERHGAVSAETAAAMAAGARQRLGADVAIAVTGIAGPGGGSEEKPVGLVYLHAEGPFGSRSADFVFPGDREGIRRRAAITALHLVRRLLAHRRDEPA